jgi:hypothetical protein
MYKVCCYVLAVFFMTLTVFGMANGNYGIFVPVILIFLLGQGSVEKT